MSKCMEQHATRSGVTRRRFLGLALGARAGLCGVLSLHQPPAIHAQKRELNIPMTAGKGSWIQNPSSHYTSAKTATLKVAERVYFHQLPAGPHGRHTVVNLRSMGVLYTWPAAPDPKAHIFIYNCIIATMYTKAVTARPSKTPSPGLRGKANASTTRASQEGWGGWRCHRSLDRRAERSLARSC